MLADVFETAFQQILFCTAAYLHAPRALTNRQVNIIWNVKKGKLITDHFVISCLNMLSSFSLTFLIAHFI